MLTAMKTGIIASLLASALILSGFSSGVAQAAPRPIGKCEQVGAKKKFKNQTFVCTKRGKKLVWVKKSSRPVTPAVVKPTPAVESADPVTAKLERMMATLPMPNLNAPAPPIRFVIEEPTDQEFIPSLEKQSLYLAQAFPEFSWKAPGVAFIPRTKEWLGTAMREVGCQEPVVQLTLSWYMPLPPIWGVGVSDCNPNLGQVGVIGLNSTKGVYPGSEWDYMISEEFAPAIFNRRFATNQLAMNSPNPSGYWALGMPRWMNEGAPNAFHAIALAKQTRTWDWDINRWGTNGSCTGVLRDYDRSTTGYDECTYTRGLQAVELMLALYGWDAALGWFSGFGNQRDLYVAFKNAYGDDYETFERYASEFFQWRVNWVPMSQELLDRLR